MRWSTLNVARTWCAPLGPRSTTWLAAVVTPSDNPLRSSTACTLTVIDSGCSDVSTLSGVTPIATSCGAFVSPAPVWVTVAGNPAATRSAVVIDRVLPEMSTSTADAFQFPGAACHGILSVAR